MAVGLALATGAALWSAPEWLIDQLARRHPGCLYRVPTQAPLVALTIDDGPDPSSTPLILAELRRQEARATFFLITGRVPGQEGTAATAPALANAIFAATGRRIRKLPLRAGAA